MSNNFPKLKVFSPPTVSVDQLLEERKALEDQCVIIRLEAEQKCAPLLASIGEIQLRIFNATSGHVLSRRVIVNSRGLTQREQAVLLRIHLPYKEIARELNISLRTVKFHAGKVLGKLGKTRLEILQCSK